MITKAEIAENIRQDAKASSEAFSRNLQIILTAMIAVATITGPILITYLQSKTEQRNVERAQIATTLANDRASDIKKDLKQAEIKVDAKVEAAKAELTEVSKQVDTKLDVIQKSVDESHSATKEKDASEEAITDQLEVIHKLVNSDMLAQKKISMDYAKKIYDLEKNEENKKAYEIAKQAYDEHDQGQKETAAAKAAKKKEPTK